MVTSLKQQDHQLSTTQRGEHQISACAHTGLCDVDMTKVRQVHAHLPRLAMQHAIARCVVDPLTRVMTRALDPAGRRCSAHQLMDTWCRQFLTQHRHLMEYVPLHAGTVLRGCTIYTPCTTSATCYSHSLAPSTPCTC
jgi:hypothetical protein